RSRTCPEAPYSADAELPEEKAPVPLGDRFVEVGPAARVLHVLAELVREARDRILVVFGELVDIEIGGLTRAGHPDTNEARLVIREHHPVLHAGALRFSLRSARAAAHAVPIDGNGSAIGRAAGEALPEPAPTGESFAPAVPREFHRYPARHASYPRDPAVCLPCRIGACQRAW